PSAPSSSGTGTSATLTSRYWAGTRFTWSGPAHGHRARYRCPVGVGAQGQPERLEPERAVRCYVGQVHVRAEPADEPGLLVLAGRLENHAVRTDCRGQGLDHVLPGCAGWFVDADRSARPALGQDPGRARFQVTGRGQRPLLRR